MPSYRFSWEHFADPLVAKLSAHAGGPGAPLEARAWLAANVKRPHDDFVRQTKDVLADYWLPTYGGTKDLVDMLREWHIGPMGSPKTPDELAAYVRKCRNTTNVRRILVQALLRFGDADKMGDAEEKLGLVPRFAVLDPQKQRDDGRQAHDYQIDAWKRMSAHFERPDGNGSFQGLVVMPTGSGKTFTTVRWLMERVVNRGLRVLWLAHRHELLTQATAEFHRQSKLSTLKEKLRVRAVSQTHCRLHQVDPADHVIVCSVGSLARSPELAKKLLSDPKLFMVIDEAHHAPAKSYRDAIEVMLAREPQRVLGITATPTRTTKSERPLLTRLFGGRTIYEVTLRELVDRGFLAEPIPVRISTKIDVEAGASAKEIQELMQFNKLPEEWAERIGTMAARNQVIVETYLKDRAKYGKTLMFAVNVPHAALLAKQLRDRGVAADYLASWRPDGTEVDRGEIVSRLRADPPKHPDALDVLVNVEMLTEGVDIPEVRTVFLTRPTQSETLVRQMIGRALRGPKAGGNPKAYLVAFEDEWRRFQDWASPLDLVPELTEPSPIVEPPVTEAPPGVVAAPDDEIAIPWEAMTKLASLVRQRDLDSMAAPFEAVPHGWYLLERQVEDEDVTQTIAVYEHQRTSYEKALDAIWRLSSNELAAADADELHAFWLGDCDPPAPATGDVLKLVEHRRAGGERPTFQVLEARAACDPSALAKKVYDDDLGEKKREALYLEAYRGPLARAIYPTLKHFRAAIDEAIFEISNPKDKRPPLGEPMFDARPDQLLAPSPFHDPTRIFAEMLEAAPAILGKALPPNTIQLEWSRRPIKGWYARATWDASIVPAGITTGRIRVNKLLDSRDVSVDCLRYLLWHEYLHLYLRAGHTKEFRTHERMWQDWSALDRELDALNEKFGIQYW